MLKSINHGGTENTEEMNRAGKQAVECDDAVIDIVIAAAIRVHKQLGPGLFESVYEKALIIELEEAGCAIKSQIDVPVSYRGKDLGIGFRADLVVNDCLLLELKAVDALNNRHVAQVIGYLKLLGFKRGYLLNFNEHLMKNGIRRISV